jgi:hypothetical protein
MNEPTNEQREILMNLLRSTKGKLRSRLRMLFTRPPEYRYHKARELSRRERRAIADLHAAVRNYSGWGLGGKLPLF